MVVLSTFIKTGESTLSYTLISSVLTGTNVQIMSLFCLQAGIACNMYLMDM